MGRLSKSEKLDVARELGVALAPYLWDRNWGFGLNMYFDDVHVDYREISSYIYDDDMARESEKVLEHFDEGCIEYGEFEGEKYETYKEFIALDDGVELYIACEQEIFEEIYLYMWQGLPGGQGMVDAITDILESHGLVFDLEGSAIVVYDAEDVEEE